MTVIPDLGRYKAEEYRVQCCSKVHGTLSQYFQLKLKKRLSQCCRSSFHGWRFSGYLQCSSGWTKMWLKDIPDLLGLQVGKQSVFTEAYGSYRNVLHRSLWKNVAMPTQGQKGALEDLRIKYQKVWRQANSFPMLLMIPV